MGASMQPQGHLQVVVNLADYGLNPQAALDAPRWYFASGNRVLLEPSVPEKVVRGLADLGHQMTISQAAKHSSLFGRGQIILQQNGVFAAGSEPRADGMAIAL